LNFLDWCLKNPQILKIRTHSANRDSSYFMWMERQTDRQTGKLIVGLQNFGNAPNILQVMLSDHHSTRRNIPKHLNLQLHLCENLKCLVLSDFASRRERYICYWELYLYRFCGPRVSPEFITSVLTIKLTARFRPVNKIMNIWSYVS
jgi:hypothetical protein